MCEYSETSELQPTHTVLQASLGAQGNSASITFLDKLTPFSTCILISLQLQTGDLHAYVSEPWCFLDMHWFHEHLSGVCTSTTSLVSLYLHLFGCKTAEIPFL